jgi:hypothetical protein
MTAKRKRSVGFLRKQDKRRLHGQLATSTKKFSETISVFLISISFNAAVVSVTISSGVEELPGLRISLGLRGGGAKTAGPVEIEGFSSGVACAAALPARDKGCI